jgi:chromosome segregation protein
VVLKEFAKISQFIVITHNKKTMEHANVMYGVTMQQRGISKVVSVKFTAGRPEPVPAQVSVEVSVAPQSGAGPATPLVEEFAAV